ncbi:MAG: prolyl aminopeptidase [Bernardetiaceae bacterium]|nr:prolyl aminopeptidase [Bernardetiaceae bacterium]
MLSQSLYPDIKPYLSGTLRVSDLHTLYYEEVGNPEGQPVLFLHGGPGGGIHPVYRRFFDPNFYRIILLDQRGSGSSTPHATLEENTTWHLVEDLESLRKHINVKNWMVFGGSWGSTLALIYAIKHKERVSALVLRGIYLFQDWEDEWLFSPTGGAARIYPDEWELFEAPIKNCNSSILKAYYDMLTHESYEVRLQAAKAWTRWEAVTSTIMPNSEFIDELTQPDLAIAIARLECHYFLNKLFIAEEDFIIKNIQVIQDIPCKIVQGRYDIVCPMAAAWTLHKALKYSDLDVINSAGHSPIEDGIAEALVRATESFKSLYLQLS